MQILNRFIKLSKIKKNLLLKSLFFAFFIRIALYLLSFSRINAYVRNIYQSGENNGEKVEDILWAVKVASDLIPRSTCLTSAILGHFMLSKYNYPSNLKIGINNQHDFEAHAWVEMDNKIVLGKLDTEYVPLMDLDNIKS